MPVLSDVSSNLLENSLRKNLTGSHTPSLDEKLISSSKSVLFNHIDFKPATNPASSHLDQLKEKYKPLNPHPQNKTFDADIDLDDDSTPKSPGSRAPRLLNNHGNRKEPAVVLFPADKIQLGWVGNRQMGGGQYNCGNTCFLNSVLQCIIYTPPLYNYLWTDHHKRNCENSGFCMICELQNHVKRLSQIGTKSAIVPQVFIHRIRVIAKHMRVGRQEDAHEFLRFMIEGLQKSCLFGYNKLDQESKDTNIINRIFGGLLRSQVVCGNCGACSDTYESFMDINLSVKSLPHIYAAFESFITPDDLNQDNAYNCSSCKRKVTAKKFMTIHHPPNVLTLQLKRFDYNRGNTKLNKHIRFFSFINIRKFSSNKQGPPLYYDLYAALVHQGASCNSGHYYSYVKGPDRCWYNANDSTISKSSENDVLNTQPYILFYVKRDCSSSKKSDNSSAKRPLIGPNLPSNQKSRPMNGLSFLSNESGLPVSRGTPTSTSSLNAKNTYSSLQAKEKSIFTNKEQTGSPKSHKSNPRIVMHIKNGKIIINDSSPVKNIKDSHMSSSSLKSKSNNNNTSASLVPYNSDSGSDQSVSSPPHPKPKSLKSNQISPTPLQSKSFHQSPVLDPSLTTTINVPGSYGPLPLNKHSIKTKLNSQSPSASSIGSDAKLKNSEHSHLSLKVFTAQSKVKVNSTTSWSISDQCSQVSPSLGSGSSGTSVASTTDWHVSENPSNRSRPTKTNGTSNKVNGSGDKKHCTSDVSESESLITYGPVLPPDVSTNKPLSIKIKFDSPRNSSHKKFKENGHVKGSFSYSQQKSDDESSVKNTSKKHKKRLSLDSEQSSTKDYSNDSHSNREEGEISDDDHFSRRKKHKKHKKHKQKKHRSDSSYETDRSFFSSDDSVYQKVKHKTTDSPKSGAGNLVNESYVKPEIDNSAVHSKDNKGQAVSLKWDHYLENSQKKGEELSNYKIPKTKNWNGLKKDSTEDNDILSELEKQKYSQKISSWDGDYNYAKAEPASSKRPLIDEYEEELDKGKVKKIKQSHNSNYFTGKNSYQAVQDKRNSHSNHFSSPKKQFYNDHSNYRRQNHVNFQRNNSRSNSFNRHRMNHSNHHYNRYHNYNYHNGYR